MDDMELRQLDIEEELTLFEMCCRCTPGRKRGPMTLGHKREKKQRMSTSDTSSARPRKKGLGSVVRIAGCNSTASLAPAEQSSPSRVFSRRAAAKKKLILHYTKSQQANSQKTGAVTNKKARGIKCAKLE